ncbi:MAG: hypothetical protein Q9161_006829 [Pseudevernia consocians]
MLADVQALPSLRPEIEIKWADQGALLESVSRPHFRETVVFHSLHWYTDSQLQKHMVKNMPNVHPGDMLYKWEFMGSWSDEVENLADHWAVPLEDRMYLKEVKEHRDTYGQAKDILDHAAHTLSLKLTGLEVR